MIPYGRQNLSEADVEAVVEVLKSDFLTQGPVVPRFERAVCAYTGASFGHAVTSGTAALHLACLAMGLAPGDRVWTTPISFVATANCARYCGADVEFVDIDPCTWNISIPRLAEKLEHAANHGVLPKLIIPVHLGGLSCDMKGLAELAEKYEFYVLEDASHALGGTYYGGKVGCCEYSDATVFSFHPVKSITTGEGGMVLTNDPQLSEKIGLLRSHGIIKSDTRFDSTDTSPWYYEQVELGFNYRMTDIQAALGYSQLNRLDDFIRRRTSLCGRYRVAFGGLPVKIQVHPEGIDSGNHLFVIRLDLSATSMPHAEAFRALREKGVNVNLHYIPIYRHPYYRERGYAFADYPESEAYYREAITLPMFFDLQEDQQDFVIRSLSEVLS